MVAPGRVTVRRWACVTRSASDTIACARSKMLTSFTWTLSVAAAPVQCGFSQITVPPMPMPMHMVVRP